MCCKIFPVPELQKPEGKWCIHCAVGHGCSVYADRPGLCRDFYCEYLINKDLEEHWKPSIARMVVTKSVHEKLCRIFVDRNNNERWKQKTYAGDIQRWANQAAHEGVRVIVIQEGRFTRVMPRP